MSAKLKLQNVRLSFPSLFNKAVFNGNVTKYEGTFLMPKGSPQHKQTQDAIDAFIAEKFQGKAPKGLKITCFTDGDEKDYDGYEGQMALKGGSTKRVLLIDKDKTPLVEEDGRLYAGCYVNAIVEFWYSDHPLGGKQILGNLLGVQFAKDGDSFGDNTGASIDDFDELDDEF
jgi:hypothetical protein